MHEERRRDSIARVFSYLLRPRQSETDPLERALSRYGVSERSYIVLLSIVGVSLSSTLILHFHRETLGNGTGHALLIGTGIWMTLRFLSCGR